MKTIKNQPNVGKYSSPMEHLGKGVPCPWESLGFITLDTTPSRLVPSLLPFPLQIGQLVLLRKVMRRDELVKFVPTPLIGENLSKAGYETFISEGGVRLWKGGLVE